MKFKEFIKHNATEPARQVLFAGMISPMDCFVLPPGWLSCGSLGSEQSLGVKVLFLDKSTADEMSNLLNYAGFASKKPDTNLALLSQATANL